MSLYDTSLAYRLIACLIATARYTVPPATGRITLTLQIEEPGDENEKVCYRTVLMHTSREEAKGEGEEERKQEGEGERSKEIK